MIKYATTLRLQAAEAYQMLRCFTRGGPEHTTSRRADASDDAAAKARDATVGETYGRLEALVNNAGLTSQTPADDLDGVDLAEWDRVFAVNVRGLFQVFVHADPAAGSPQPRGERGLDRRAPAGPPGRRPGAGAVRFAERSASRRARASGPLSHAVQPAR